MYEGGTLKRPLESPNSGDQDQYASLQGDEVGGSPIVPTPGGNTGALTPQDSTKASTPVSSGFGDDGPAANTTRPPSASSMSGYASPVTQHQPGSMGPGVGVAHSQFAGGTPPYPMLYQTTNKRARLDGGGGSGSEMFGGGASGGVPGSMSPNNATGATPSERLTSLHDRYAYQPGQDPASTVFGRYNAMLNGGAMPVQRGMPPVAGGLPMGHNGGVLHTMNGMPVNGHGPGVGIAQPPRPPASFQELVTQLMNAFAHIPPQIVYIAAQQFKSFEPAASWLATTQGMPMQAQTGAHHPGHAAGPGSYAPAVSRMAAKRDVGKPVMSIREKFSSRGMAGGAAMGYPGPGMPYGAAPGPFAHYGAPAVYQAPQQRRRLTKQNVRDNEEHWDVSDESSDEDEVYDRAQELEFEKRVLKFLNTASIEDVADVSGMTEEQVQPIIDGRPFASLYGMRKVQAETTPGDTSSGSVRKRGNPKKSIGEKVVDASLTTMRGYEAVDSLIKECEKLGKEVSEGIKDWGIDIFGADSNEESGLAVTEVKPEGDEEEEDGIKVKKGGYFDSKPKLLGEDVELKDYQQVGVNWINLLYKKGLSCILADEMGLGKTCQVIAFLAHLKEIGAPGPHLVVVPASTLENWLREFQRFCPSMVLEPYYGNQNERAEMRDAIMESNANFDVMVTTYNLACGGKADLGFLKSLKFNVCVYDEGHMLKNSQSERYAKLMKLKANFRLLLTGTPLQNNLKELVSLLAFMMPNLFEECREDLAGVFKHRIKTNVRGDTEDGNGANLLLSEQRIQKAKTMMTPFVLRRKKDQVLKHLPEKRQRIEYCDMVPAQQAIYNEQMKSSRDLLEARANGEKTKNLGNILMQLRKAAIHPLLFRRIFSDKVLKGMAKEIMKEDRYKEANETYIFEDMEVMTDAELHYLCEQFPGSIGKHLLKEDEWNNSGKIKKLLKLLPEMKARGDRILLFSQFTQVLDILERVLNHINVTFIRLDGGTPVEIRQDMIDKFHNETDITVFLLSTRAGGFGINLACANVVILFDLSFNPHDDRQAEDRAHRVGQTREVDVIRLITKDSIEESIYAVQKTKLALDKHVSSDENAQEADKTERHNASLVASMIFNTKVEDSEA